MASQDGVDPSHVGGPGVGGHWQPGGRLVGATPRPGPWDMVQQGQGVAPSLAPPELAQAQAAP